MSPLRPIDCDVHPPPPPIAALLPYLDRHWRDSVIARGIDGFDLVSYPPNSPLSFRPDWRPASHNGSALEAMRHHIFDPLGTKCLTLPSAIRFLMVPATSSIGTFGSTRCW